jgi:hypothetical protein
MAESPMISRERMFEPMLVADPSFTPAWNAFVEEYSDAPELPHYLALADLARHLIGQLARGDTARFPAVFAVVEQWHLHGDPYVREAATVGLLEDLQNGNLHSVTRPEEFLPWLSPVNRRWWDKVERFWSHGERIAED